jgi:hypothetical protein
MPNLGDAVRSGASGGRPRTVVRQDYCRRFSKGDSREGLTEDTHGEALRPEIIGSIVQYYA